MNADHNDGALERQRALGDAASAQDTCAAAHAISESPEPKLCSLPVYALIDPFFREPFLCDVNSNGIDSFEKLRAARVDGWGREITVAAGQEPLIDPLRLPYIVALDGAEDPLLPKLYLAAQAEAQEALETDVGVFSVGSLIQTELDPVALMSRLESMWTFRVQGADRYLRLADPRVFELLTHICASNDLKSYLGPIARWHLRTRNGVWVAHAGKAEELSNASEEMQLRRSALLAEFAELPARLATNQSLAQQLLHSEAVSRGLTQLQSVLGASGSKITTETYRSAWRANTAAAAAGLKHMDDLAAYIWRAVVDPRYFDSPPARQALASARTHAGTLAHQLSTLDAAAPQGADIG